MTVFHTLNYFSKDHEVHLIAHIEPEEERYRAATEALCASCTLIPFTPLAGKWRSFKALFGSLPLQTAYYRSRALNKALEQKMAEIKPDLL